MTTYLYAKQHRDTGLRYFGKTTRDPLKYNGSGKYWTAHCNKHGWNIETTWTHAYEDTVLAKNEAIFFSTVYDIVASAEWANLKIENLDGGSAKGQKKSAAACNKMSLAKAGKPSGRNTNYRKGTKHSEATIEKMRQAQLGERNYMYGKTRSDEYKAKHSARMTEWWATRKQKEQL